MHIVDLAAVPALVEPLASGRRSESGSDTPRVVASGNFATPLPLLRAVDAGLSGYRLHMLNAHGEIPSHEGVIHETAFVGPAMRRSVGLSYVPARLSLLPLLFRSALPPDIVVVHTSMPRDGSVSLGVETNVLPAAIESVRARGGLVLAQMNPAMPYTFGDAEIPMESVDYAVEVDEPLLQSVPTTPDDASRRIGEQVAARIPDGATIQLGIGLVPDSTLPGLAGRRDLRLWSETFSDGVLELDRAGALDPDTPLVSSFIFGSEQLYRWVDRNPRIRVMRTEFTNDPARICAHPNFVSINSALEVDLFVQANASRINNRIYSGFGGQNDFLVGALHSPGGQAFIALRSWHPKADVSSIIPLLGEPATSFQASAVVTEQGLAQVWGCDQSEQAARLIRHAAHPDVREELEEEARALGL